MNVIEIRNLTRRFGDFVALNDLTFHVQQGETFGFLGPNGAGRRTTIRMVYGLLSSSDGTVHVAGIDCSLSRLSRGGSFTVRSAATESEDA